MTDPHLQVMIQQLQQKVIELESKLRRIENIVTNIDGNTAQTVNMVRELLRKK